MIKIGTYYINKREEKCISRDSGCGVIYLTGCNMHCCYCSAYRISQDKIGTEISDEQFADILLKLMREGCSHLSIANLCDHLDGVVRAINIAKTKGLNIPFVYNTNGYDEISVLRKIKPIFDIYLVDFKYADNKTGHELSGIDDYYNRFVNVAEYIKSEFESNIYENGLLKKGVLLRHLVIPNYYENSEDVINLISSLGLHKYPFNLMNQYVPEYKVQKNMRLNCFVDDAVYNELRDFAVEHNIRIL